MTKRGKIKPKKAFDLWYEFDNLHIACNVYHKETGIKISVQGMQYARDLYVIRNPEVAKSFIVPELMTKENWDEFLVRRLMNVYRRAPEMGTGYSIAFHRHIKKNNLERFSWLYADKFGITKKRKSDERSSSESVSS